MQFLVLRSVHLPHAAVILVVALYMYKCVERYRDNESSYTLSDRGVVWPVGGGR